MSERTNSATYPSEPNSSNRSCARTDVAGSRCRPRETGKMDADWNTSSSNTPSNRARSKSSTSRSSSASSRGRRRAARSSRACSDREFLDPDGRGAAAGRSGHGGAGVVQGRPRDALREAEPKLAGSRRRACATRSSSTDRKVLYSWIGGTRRDWRGQGHFRALTEESEAWAHAAGFHEVVVKTKNRFYDMRGTLDQLEFDVIKYELEPRATTASRRCT